MKQDPRMVGRVAPVLDYRYLTDAVYILYPRGSYTKSKSSKHSTGGLYQAKLLGGGRFVFGDDRYGIPLMTMYLLLQKIRNSHHLWWSCLQCLLCMFGPTADEEHLG